MKKYSATISRFFMVILGLACLAQSTALEAYSFQEFKTAFRQTYPTWDTPLKDLKVMYHYGQKKLSRSPISETEAQTAIGAFKRTGLPVAVILALIGGGGIAGWRYYQKRKIAPATEAEKKSQAIVSLTDDPQVQEKFLHKTPNQIERIHNNFRNYIERKIGILGINKQKQNPLHTLVAFYNYAEWKTDRYNNTQPFSILSLLIQKVKEELSGRQFKDYINAKDEGNNTVLRYMTSGAELEYVVQGLQKQHQLIELLLKNGANPNMPFHVLDDYFEHALIEEPPSPLSYRSDTLTQLIKNMQLLVKYGAVPSEKYQNSPIWKKLHDEAFYAALGHPTRTGTPRERAPEAVGALAVPIQEQILEYVIGRPLYEGRRQPRDPGEKTELPILAEEAAEQTTGHAPALLGPGASGVPEAPPEEDTGAGVAP